MTAMIEGDTLAQAWVATMEHLVACRKGKDHHVVVAFSRLDDSAVRREIDAVLTVGADPLRGPWSTGTTANTIFPSGLYHPRLGDEAAPRLYESHALAMKAQRRMKRRDLQNSYFDRMAAYPTKEGPFNQLDYFIGRLAKQIAKEKGGPLSSAYEIGVSDPETDVRVQVPGEDRGIMSFPCLSHVSLTYSEGAVNLAATYRNQMMVERGYGNFLGLARLASFVAHEVGADAGEVMVVATHADAGFESLGKRRVQGLLERSQAALEGQP